MEGRNREAGKKLVADVGRKKGGTIGEKQKKLGDRKGGGVKIENTDHKSVDGGTSEYKGWRGGDGGKPKGRNHVEKTIGKTTKMQTVSACKTFEKKKSSGPKRGRGSVGQGRANKERWRKLKDRSKTGTKKT